MLNRLLLIAVLVGGCAPDSSTPPEEASDAGPDAPPLSEQVPGSEEPPSVSMHPIVDATHAQLFGAWAGEWVSAESTAARLTGPQPYRLYSATGFAGEARGSPPGPPSETCTNPAVHVEGASEAPPDLRDLYGLAAGWEALPRVPAALDPRQEDYRDAVAEMLRSHGIEDPQVEIGEIFRVDLEGDGTDEVLLSGSLRRGRGTSAQPGDYAFAVLRRVVDDEVRTIPLEEEYYPEGCIADCAPARYRVSAVLDFNGDGVMEIVLAYDYHEAEGRRVYAVDKAADERTDQAGDEPGVHAVLEWRCGV